MPIKGENDPDNAKARDDGIIKLIVMDCDNIDTDCIYINDATLTELDIGGRFHQHFLPTFLRGQNEKLFSAHKFGEWQMANGVWRILM